MKRHETAIIIVAILLIAFFWWKNGVSSSPNPTNAGSPGYKP